MEPWDCIKTCHKNLMYIPQTPHISIFKQKYIWKWSGFSFTCKTDYYMSITNLRMLRFSSEWSMSYRNTFGMYFRKITFLPYLYNINTKEKILTEIIRTMKVVCNWFKENIIRGRRYKLVELIQKKYISNITIFKFQYNQSIQFYIIIKIIKGI